jgi:hypothetical protein
MAISTAHDCPAKGCPRRVGQRMLMCRAHWFMVPKPLRDAVNDAYRGGLGAGSGAHRAAVLDAIGAVNAKLTAQAAD